MTDPLKESIGDLAMAHASLDLALAIVLGELLETHFETAICVNAALDRRKRIQLIDSLASLKLKDDLPTLAKVIVFSKACRGLAKERNYAVHSVWYDDTDAFGKRRTVRLDIMNDGIFKIDRTPRSPGHMKSKARDTAKLTNRAADLALEIRASVQAWRQKYPPIIPPHLATELVQAEANPHKS